ncbi:hypothetical protein QBC46DRAFT_404548 [Diplogelasinospora grovesii]|uniref:Uncharacterized protein n=1 Tax=Diplogelasinospora grovesii TaxID=303347 RepID=A0AAN6NFR7_9PEZI|nr:hypothetical protein QBC46DRAFT_404548 [Diplogelasinospora grovesii]
MKTSITAVVLSLAALSQQKPIQKREVGGVLICNGPNATGSCTYAVYQMDTCYNMTAPYYQNAATFAPDGEAFYCYPYMMPCGGICTSPEGCTLGAVDFGYEHKYNLTAVGWDKYIASFECHLNNTQTQTTKQ